LWPAAETGTPEALVVHGENNERVPLAAVLDWARPQLKPVVVIPGANHFFSGHLHVLREIVNSHLAAMRSNLSPRSEQ
jgi:alpha/beta superfamily hydrolase